MEQEETFGVKRERRRASKSSTQQALPPAKGKSFSSGSMTEVPPGPPPWEREMSAEEDESHDCSRRRHSERQAVNELSGVGVARRHLFLLSLVLSHLGQCGERVSTLTSC